MHLRYSIDRAAELKIEIPLTPPVYITNNQILTNCADRIFKEGDSNILLKPQ